LAVAREESVPTYQYACTDCGGQIEVVQKFSDDPLTVHDACGGKLRKVFSPVGIVFKGSGFYRTDSRGGSGPTVSTPSKSSPDSGSAAGSPDSGSSSASPAPASSGGDKSSSSASGKSAEKVA
jgi:putative FmdB family regulatory protein